MIRSLEDVERYSRNHARDLPSIADSIELRRPGLNDLEVVGLRRAVPGLTDDYLDIARTWNLEPVSIGYFDLRPPAFGDNSTMIDRLMAANGPANPMFDALVEFGVVEVASYAGDSIVLARKGSARSGQVFRLVPDVDFPLRLRFVANSFADLLKAATQLDSHRATGREGVAGVESFLSGIADYIPDLAIDEWRIFAEVTLGDG